MATYCCSPAAQRAVTLAQLYGQRVLDFSKNLLQRFGCGVQKGISVIGPRDTYQEFARKIGANYFKLAEGEIWTRGKNIKFLEEIVQRGDDVFFAGKFNPKILDPNSPLAMEINYLIEHGYRWTDDFTKLIKR